jgi:hypothetical protein
MSLGATEKSRWEPLSPAQVKSEYLGEENGNAMLQIFRGRQVTYLKTPQERFPYLVQIKDGKFFNHEGVQLDTRSAVTKNMHGISRRHENGIFVFGEDSKIYLSLNSQAGVFHHSSFLAGEPVWFAGEMGIENGSLVYLNNNSGHYAPRVRHGLRFLNQIEDAGVDLSKVAVDFHGHGYEIFFFGQPNSKELEHFTRYALADYFRKSYNNPNLMPMMKRYEAEIRQNLLKDPRALVHFLNTTEISLMPEQEEILIDAVEKYRTHLFDDPIREKKFKTHFSRQTVSALSPICKVPEFLKNIFGSRDQLSH